MGDVVSMKEYVDALRAADARIAEVRANYQDLATQLSRDNLNIRLAGMNEIREQLTDQANRTATKESVVAVEKSLVEVKEALAASLGRRQIGAPLVDKVLQFALALLLAYVVWKVTK